MTGSHPAYKSKATPGGVSQGWVAKRKNSLDTSYAGMIRFRSGVDAAVRILSARLTRTPPVT